MKIATWNLQRLKHKRKLTDIVELLLLIDADILVLTETDERIQLPRYPHQITTVPYFAFNNMHYESTERAIKIYSKYPIVKQLKTFNAHTTIAVEIAVAAQHIVLYGTIMGMQGNQHKSYQTEVDKQLEDFNTLAPLYNLCIVGDYNCSFSDNYYFSKNGREQLLQAFATNNLTITTQAATDTIDHITIANNLLTNTSISLQEFNEKKDKSDHKGIAVTLVKV